VVAETELSNDTKLCGEVCTPHVRLSLWQQWLSGESHLLMSTKMLMRMFPVQPSLPLAQGDTALWLQQPGLWSRSPNNFRWLEPEPEPKHCKWWSRSLKFEVPCNSHSLLGKRIVQIIQRLSVSNGRNRSGTAAKNFRVWNWSWSQTVKMPGAGSGAGTRNLSSGSAALATALLNSRLW